MHSLRLVRFAVLSLNVTQLEKQADKGEKTAQRLLRLNKRTFRDFYYYEFK